MSQEKIALDGMALLQEHVHGYEQLEILIPLHGQPGQALLDQAVAHGARDSRV